MRPSPTPAKRRGCAVDVCLPTTAFSPTNVRFGSLADIGSAQVGCPLHPQKQTCSELGSMSAKCHEQTLTLHCHLSICRAKSRRGEAHGRVACARTLRGADADAAPKPDPSLPLGHRSAQVARCDNQKPLRPTYPCEHCANLVPYYYSDACQATWDDRQRAERLANIR